MRSALVAAAAASLTIATWAHAAELVVNGNFESGNVGFSSDYAFVSGPASSEQGTPTYGLATSPRASANAYSDWGTYGDHTSGTGLMLAADASAARAWYETNIGVVGGVTYTYSFWARQADASSGSNPNLVFSVDGAPVGSLAVTSSSADGWQHATGTFSVATSGPASFAISDTNNSVTYNDFALDDISVTSPSGAPEPSTWR